MITPLLKLALEPIAARHRGVRLSVRLAVCWAAFGLLALAHVLPSMVIALLACVVAFVVIKVTSRWDPDYLAIARLVEQRHPELHALLVTAVEQRPDPQTGKLHFLQRRVVEDAVTKGREGSWLDAVPTSRWAGAAALQWLLMGGFIVSLAHLHHSATGRMWSAPIAPGISVTPGDVSIERGSGLIVLATFGGDVPSEATLVLQPVNQPPQRTSLVKNLDDPVFGGGLPEVDSDLNYRIEYAGQTTRDFKVTVFEHPRLDRADATLTFPEYTHLPEKVIPDTRRVSAVEGTRLDVEFQLNKPVKSARLVAKDKTKISLTVDAQKATARLHDFPLNAGETYQLELEDTEGRANKLPAQFVVDVRKNRRPELKFEAPKGDQSVTSLQEVAFKAEAWDDFGMTAYGLSYTVAGEVEKEIVLGRDSKADERLIVEHLLKLEDLSVQTDQLVSWFLWADDLGPDGKPRRTSSDMFFAEVRPFDEIFRAGQAGEGEQQQQSQQGNAAQKLAQLQKQIITATWNLKRATEADGGDKPTEKYLKDEPVVRDGQQDALKQATELQKETEDPRSKGLIENATREMQSALDRLNEAEKSPSPLAPALVAEQAAYNALLKLAAHEFEVTRSQKGQGEQRGEQQRQAQLDQLEMKEEKNLYETKREAQPMQNEEQREQLALVNRLKELAQRQGDINERVKELQTALQEATTEKEKEDAQRELKRLREQEQQLLADLDETKQRMEQAKSAPQLADERKQLEQTRSEAQKAAESMQNGRPSQALAAGTRAQNDLQKLRDDLRKKTAGQFNDALKQMRNDARELARNQEELGQKLAEPEPQAQRTLSGSSPREQLQQKFDEQTRGLGNLRENLRDVSEKAETAEPLLAKELYDALRKSTQAGTDQTLERAGQLATRGYGPQARKFEEKARQEIEDLKKGVERAAESVLGNEAEALRQARAELDALTKELNREIGQANPALADGSSDPKERAAGSAPNAEGGEASNEKAQTGQPRSTAQNREGEGDQPGDGAEKPGGQSGKKEGEPGQQPGGQGGGDTPSTAQTPKGNQPANGGAQEGQPGERPGEGKGQRASTESGKGKGEGGDAKPGTPTEQPGSRLRELAQSPKQRGGIPTGGESGAGDRGGGAEVNAGPLRGDGFVQWSDRLRNVEEMLDQPELRNEAARVREVAESVRAEFKRHSVEPKWDLVKTKIQAPLAELRDRLSEELARRESKEALVPIDRDPVPQKYSEHVRRYYEDLGRSR